MCTKLETRIGQRFRSVAHEQISTVCRIAAVGSWTMELFVFICKRDASGMSILACALLAASGALKQ